MGLFEETVPYGSTLPGLAIYGQNRLERKSGGLGATSTGPSNVGNQPCRHNAKSISATGRVDSFQFATGRTIAEDALHRKVKDNTANNDSFRM